MKMTLLLLTLGFYLSILATAIYGAYLSFCASLLMGLVVLLVEPLPFVIGLASLMTRSDVAHRLLDGLHRLLG